MVDPKDVFDHPDQYWPFIKLLDDNDFEGQYFDRKEACQPGNNGFVSKGDLDRLRDEVTECISAFANANHAGGLLVIGVAKTGEIKGISHLQDAQRNSLMRPADLLRNHAATCRLVDCQNTSSHPDKVIFIYVPESTTGICETLGSSPKAWSRSGAQNVPLNDTAREQLRRDKRIVDFERSYCCPFNLSDVDKEVLQEFRKAFMSEAKLDYSDEELLYHAGAIDRDGGRYVFNNAGWLFFAANPQRVMAWAYTRLLRYECDSVQDSRLRGSPSFDRKFDGSIAQQIRKLQAFVRESGFFKVYQTRGPDGTFVEEPELPHIAIDEAIVNAVAHRDYGIQLPIECYHFRDAFVVENPGRILQRDQEVPAQFSLEDTRLNSMPRNSKLIDWLKALRFVRAISEGTVRMLQEMKDANLPAPVYKTTPARTIAALSNNAVEREARGRASLGPPVTQYTNLFPLSLLTSEGAEVSLESTGYTHQQLSAFLVDALEAKGWFVDRVKFGHAIIAHRRGATVDLPDRIQEYVRFYPAYIMQFREYWSRLYLCIDFTLEVKSVKSVARLIRLVAASELVGKSVTARVSDIWQRGKLVTANAEFTRIVAFDSDQERQVPSEKVIPDLPLAMIEQILEAANIDFDLPVTIKKHSLALGPGAARLRAERTIATAEQLAASAFPLTIADARIELITKPEQLYPDIEKGPLVMRGLSEPPVEFNHGQESADIRLGITKFGAYAHEPKTIELVPICTDGMRQGMVSLIDRLKAGKYRYLGSERTFSTRLTYNAIFTVPNPEAAVQECERLIGEHPEWAANEKLERIFLIHAPEAGYASDDEKSPYYRTKRLLLEQGIPCQMVDTTTLQNPDWKDLNLALNVIAKCGVTPWVLPDRIPDVDFFVGLSYTQSRKRGTERLLGYSTVFNQFGRWEFYCGNTETFSYEERTTYFSELTRQTLQRLEKVTLRDAPNICFHYSARFSRDDRQAILRAARDVRPGGTYSFVSINSHHSIRLYDSRPETDGSLSRGSYVITTPNQILLSTTGYNPFRKSLGTPQPLEITVWIERPADITSEKPDLRSLAMQILSLTKLNWASTDSICGEPITTKYAGDIAYLTAAFLRQAGSFHLHQVLERTPWFI